MINVKSFLRILLAYCCFGILISCTQQVTVSEDTKHEVLFLLGNNFAKLKNFNHALETYLQVVKSYPRDSKAISNIGVILNNTGHHKLALNCYLKASKLTRGKYIPLQNNIAITYAILGQTQTAIDILEKIKTVHSPYHESIEYTYNQISRAQTVLQKKNLSQEEINAVHKKLLREFIPYQSSQVLDGQLVTQIRTFCSN